jgi:hypothetical protein
MDEQEHTFFFFFFWSHSESLSSVSLCSRSEISYVLIGERISDRGVGFLALLASVFETDLGAVDGVDAASFFVSTAFGDAASFTTEAALSCGLAFFC